MEPIPNPYAKMRLDTMEGVCAILKGFAEHEARRLATGVVLRMHETGDAPATPKLLEIAQMEYDCPLLHLDFLRLRYGHLLN